MSFKTVVNTSNISPFSQTAPIQPPTFGVPDDRSGSESSRLAPDPGGNSCSC